MSAPSGFVGLITFEVNGIVTDPTGATPNVYSQGVLGKSLNNLDGNQAGAPVGVTNLSIANRTTTTLTVVSNTGTDAVVPASSATEAGLMTAADNVKLASIAAGATVYTDEMAQDAVGGILVDTATIAFTYADATPSITANVRDGSITYAKIQDVAGLSVIGRSTNSSGVSGAITGTDGQVLRVAGTALGFGTIVAAGIASDAVITAKILDANVTYAKIQNGTGLSVLGRAANSGGVNADIVGTDGQVLRVSGTALGFGTIVAAGIASDAIITAKILDANVTYAKIQNVAALSVFGRGGSFAGVGADITGTADQVLRVSGAGSALAFGAIDLSKTAAATGVLQAASMPALTGDVTTVAGALATTLATVNSNVGAFGSASNVATFTVNAKGLITAAANVSILTNRLDQFAAPNTDVSWNSHKITNLLDPTAAQDAATKLYVDTVAQGLDAKASVLVSSTANLTLSGEQTIDGQLTSASRILVRHQTAPAENGIYVTAAGAWARSSDMDTWLEVPGSFTFVEKGTLYGDCGFVCTADAGGTLNTTAMTWAQFSGAGTYTAGAGLTLTGTQFSIGTGQVTNTMLAGSIAYSKLVLTGAILNADLAGSIAASKLVGTDIATVGTITSGVWNAGAITTSGDVDIAAAQTLRFGGVVSFRANGAAVYSTFVGQTTGTNGLFAGTGGAEQNTAVGFGALQSATSTVKYSTAIGVNALAVANNSSHDNTALGRNAGVAVTSGAYNTLLGAQAGQSLTTGSQNIIIGFGLNANSVSANGQINIGNLIFATGATGTGTTYSGSVGFGTPSPSSILDLFCATNALTDLTVQNTQAIVKLGTDSSAIAHLWTTSAWAVAVGVSGAAVTTWHGSGNSINTNFNTGGIFSINSLNNTVTDLTVGNSQGVVALGASLSSVLHLWSTGAWPLLIGVNSSADIAISTSHNVTMAVGYLYVSGTAFTSTFDAQVVSQSALAYNASPVAGWMGAFKYDSSANIAAAGGIAVGKENATDGNYASYLALYTRTHGSGIAERMRIDSGGNVGIGTTSPQTKAHVVGALLLEHGVGGSLNEALRFAQATIPTIYFHSIYAQQSGTVAENALQFRIANGAATQATVMTLLGNGYVGIGTTGPLTTMHVAGGTSAYISGLGTLLVTGGTLAKRLAMGVDSSGTMYSWIQSIESGVALRDLALNPSGGSVGIGALPVAKFSVLGTQHAPSLTDGDGTAVFYATGGYSHLQFGSDDTTPYGAWLQVNTGAGVAQPLLLNPNGGNIGIGTRVPLYKLHVGAGADAAAIAGSITPSFYVSEAGSTAFAVRNSTDNVEFAAGVASNQVFLGARTDHPVYFQQNGNNYLAIISGGNVGIGTLVPTGSTLHVAKVSQTDNTNSAAFFSDGSAIGKGVAVGYNAGSDYGYIQSVSKGVAYKPLLLNVEGGDVFIGTATNTIGTKLVVAASISVVSTFAATTWLTIGIDVASAANPNTYGGMWYDTSKRLNIEGLSGGVAWSPVYINMQGGAAVNVGGNFAAGGGITATLTIAAGATSGFYLGAVQTLYKSGNYNTLTDPAGTARMLWASNANDTNLYFDSNAYIFRDLAGTTTYMNISSAGSVGIGTTTSPAFRLSISNTASAPASANGGWDSGASTLAVIGIDSTAAHGVNEGSGIVFRATNPGATMSGYAAIRGAVETAGTYNGYLAFLTRDNGAYATERMRITSTAVTIDTSTNVGIGLSPTGTWLNGTTTAALQVHGATADKATVGFARYTNDANGAALILAKSRNGTVGSHTIVVSGDMLGRIFFQGSTGTGFATAAEVRGESDGTPGASNDMPGRLTFWTVPDGSGTSTERARINSAGQIGINTTAPGSTFASMGAVTAPVLDINATADADTIVLRLIHAAPSPTAVRQIAMEFGVTDGSGSNKAFSAARIYAVANASFAYATNRLTFATPTASATWTDTMTLMGAKVGIGTIAPANAFLHIGANTTTVAHIKLTAGTNLTTAVAGAVEFDGVAFYATSVASARQVVTTEQFVITVSDVTLASNTTAQSIFNAANDVLTVQGSTTYEFEALYYITHGTTSHGTSTLFTLGGGASITSIMYVITAFNTVATTGTPTCTVATVATATAFDAANVGSTTVIKLRGIIRMNAGGTITPQIQFVTAGPGGTVLGKANSFFRLWPVGSNTVEFVGNWA